MEEVIKVIHYPKTFAHEIFFIGIVLLLIAILPNIKILVDVSTGSKLIDSEVLDIRVEDGETQVIVDYIDYEGNLRIGKLDQSSNRLEIGEIIEVYYNEDTPNGTVIWKYRNVTNSIVFGILGAIVVFIGKMALIGHRIEVERIDFVLEEYVKRENSKLNMNG